MEQQTEEIQDQNPWYNNSMVLWELAKQLQYKYLSIRKPAADGKVYLVRYLLGYNPDLIKKSVAKYGGFQRSFKLYFDLAVWNKDMPMFSFDEDQRESQRNEFNEKWENYFVGYDYAIDLDARDKNPYTAHKEAVLIKEFFDKYKIPYSVKFSGSKGFHFLIPHEFLPARIKKTNLVPACEKTTNWLIKRFNLKHVDDSIYDHRRILKLAYSTDGDKVCLPLTDAQFNNFKLDDMTIGRVFHTVKIYNRGLLIRKHDLSNDQLRRNVQALFKQDFSNQDALRK